MVDNRALDYLTARGITNRVHTQDDYMIFSNPNDGSYHILAGQGDLAYWVGFHPDHPGIRFIQLVEGGTGDIITDFHDNLSYAIVEIESVPKGADLHDLMIQARAAKLKYEYHELSDAIRAVAATRDLDLPEGHRCIVYRTLSELVNDFDPDIDGVAHLDVNGEAAAALRKQQVDAKLAGTTVVAGDRPDFMEGVSVSDMTRHLFDAQARYQVIVVRALKVLKGYFDSTRTPYLEVGQRDSLLAEFQSYLTERGYIHQLVRN